MLCIITCLVAVVIGIIGGAAIISTLRRLHVGQNIREIGPTWHRVKQGTPTMGGIVFMLSCLVCVVTGWPAMLRGDYSHLVVFGFALVCGLIGFADDFIKIKNKRNLGLTELQKLALQLVTAGIFLAVVSRLGYLTSALYIPFVNVTVQIPWALYVLLSIFIIVGTVNAVNLTDGIDGLCTGVTIPVMVFFAVTALMWGRMGASLFASALAGGLVAFLMYNFHPASVFMGDTGSLFLGGAVCALAYVLDMPLILILVGIVYICETLSDIIQVSYFKLTHGKRIFKMAPLHHHFEKCGWSEVKIFLVFTLVTVAFCALAFVGVVHRGAF